MIKKKVLAIEDRDESSAATHVIIDWDRYCPNPLKDYDQVFLLHSRIPDEFSGNECDKDYDNPLVEIVDEDGYGTGEYRFRDGVVHFPVSAYIHSGIALRMGSIREFPCDPGGWDTTRNAAYMWTDRERFESMYGKDCWMTVYDEDTKTRRPAKDEAEFRKFLWEIAKSELELFQKYLDGECFWFREETRVPFKRVYADGHEVDDCDWKEENSCGGFYVDSIDDIDFSKDEDTDVFDATGHFVGDEWTIPELVVMQPARDGLEHTYMLAEGEKAEDGAFKEAKWTVDLKEAKVFHHWSCAYNAFLKDGKRLWQFPEFAANGGHDAIKDKDDLKTDNVGDESDIPKYVVVKYGQNPTGTVRFFLKSIERDESGKVTSSIMTPLLEEAKTFSSWHEVQSVAQDVIGKEQYDENLNIRKIDDLRGK